MDILSAAREEAKNKNKDQIIAELSEQVKNLHQQCDKCTARAKEPEVYQIDESDEVVADIDQIKKLVDNILATNLAQPDKVSGDKIKLCNDAIGLFNHYLKTMINKASITKFKYPVCGAGA